MIVRPRNRLVIYLTDLRVTEHSGSYPNRRTPTRS